MKIDLQLIELRRVMERMGAVLSTWAPTTEALTDRERVLLELEAGVEISLDELTTVAGGLLTWKGEQVILYIKDTRQDEYTLRYDTENARRFHIFDCNTLDRMKREGRFERYVVTRNRTGNFLVEATDPDTRKITELEAQLLVCKYCIQKLNWNGYADAPPIRRPPIWKSFSIEEFLAEFATFFRNRPTHTDLTAPRGGYAPDWSKISTNAKARAGWTCEECGVNCKDHRSLLNSHHKNGVVSDNSPGNIRVLCLLCHSIQPSHQWFKVSTQARLKIEALRREQNCK